MKKTRIASALTMFLLPALLATRAHPATLGNLEDCSQKKDMNRAIAGCSEAIRTGSNDPQVFVNRGFAYFLKFDYDPALADFEEAIRLNPKEAAAFHFRGVVLQIKGDDDRAIADFTKALDLGSKDPLVLVDRGIAYAAKGATTQSIADYGTAIQQDPNNWFAYMFRGVVYTYDGALEKAQADFKRGAEIAPKIPHFALWLHIAERRANTTNNLASTNLASATGKFDMTKWPAPAMRMFLGEETPAAALAYGAANVEKAIPYGACEANFYVAEFMYQQDRRDEALRLYKAAQRDCRRNFLEYIAVKGVLRSLGAKP